MKNILLVFLVLPIASLFGQEEIPQEFKKKDSLVPKDVRTKPKKPFLSSGKDTIKLAIEDYKIINFARDTTYLDTTLTIQKEYTYNYLRQDDFELMPFSNIGQAYNKLGVSFERKTLYPSLGAAAKDYKYLEKEQIVYYNVPTPMTELFFKTTLEQGQLLDANLTFNTTKRLNFSIGYIGHRSLGKYNSNQVQSGNFTLTTNYVSRNERYALRGHIAAQNITSQENGGLSEKELQFESGDEDFINRPRVDVRFDNADNKILGKRYYLDQTYKLIRKQKDSSSMERTSLSIGHLFEYETKYYQFLHKPSDDYFGASILSDVDDKAYLKTFYNEINAQFFNETLGRLTANVSMYNYDYFFNSELITSEGQLIQSQLRDVELALGGAYQKRIGSFDLDSSLKYNLSGNLGGVLLDINTSYTINSKNSIRFKLHSSTRMPNFNFLLYQSEYLNYNWQNTENFEKEGVNSLEGELVSEFFGSISAKFTKLDNYTYFTPTSEEVIVDGTEYAFVKPQQESNGITYLKLKYAKEFKLGKFALNNTIMYQGVAQDNQVFNVPQLVTRNTLYFSSDVFKKAMYLQTGITFKYFSSYYMDAYNPVLAEFMVQNKEKLGGYPLLDFFINARVKQTRIYLKAEHFNSSFSGYNFYSAPDYPFRDYVIRFGLVWNFFS